MAETREGKSKGKPVAVVIGATSKWQADGRNTRLIHGKAVDDSTLPVGVRWGIGGAIAQKFAGRGLLHRADDAQRAQCGGPDGGDQGPGRRLHDRRARSRQSRSWSRPPSLRSAARPAIPRSWSTMRAISKAATCRRRRSFWNTSRSRCSTPPSISRAAGRSWSPRKSCRRCARRARARSSFPTIRARCAGSKRMTGQSLYYPRVMMRTLAQVLTEEYSEHGVHVANVVIDGTIDSPGTHALPRITEPRPGDEPGEDRRGVLLPAYPGPLVLDARAAADAVFDEAELLDLMLLPR